MRIAVPREQQPGEARVALVPESVKKLVATGAGTFPVTGALFVTLLIGTILLVGALTFLPALTLTPILEHFLMLNGKLF